ncbi:hypothetical protein AVEN_108032-1, partial [Araneus ventricosus]
MLKRLAESSIYELNPQSTPDRDGMDGLKAADCGVDFVPQKFRATRYFIEFVGVLSINCFMTRG